MAAPAAVPLQNQSPSWRLDGLAGPGRCGFETIGLHVVDRKTQHKRCREPVAQTWWRPAVQPVGDVAGAVARRQAAQPDRGAAVLADPVLMSVGKQQYFRLQPGRERLGGAGRDRCGNERRLPGGVGLRARVVFREILDQDRPVLAFEQP